MENETFERGGIDWRLFTINDKPSVIFLQETLKAVEAVWFSKFRLPNVDMGFASKRTLSPEAAVAYWLLEVAVSTDPEPSSVRIADTLEKMEPLPPWDESVREHLIKILRG